MVLWAHGRRRVDWFPKSQGTAVLSSLWSQIKGYQPVRGWGVLWPGLAEGKSRKIGFHSLFSEETPSQDAPPPQSSGSEGWGGLGVCPFLHAPSCANSKQIKGAPPERRAS